MAARSLKERINKGELLIGVSVPINSTLNEVEEIIITASGGPFLNTLKKKLFRVKYFLSILFHFQKKFFVLHPNEF